MENQVLFLHEEFSKQVAFPRKALETEFSYFISTYGDEMHGIDVTHKLSWIQVCHLLLIHNVGIYLDFDPRTLSSNMSMICQQNAGE